MSKPQAVFFDWDGTLADSFGFLLAGHNEVLKHFALKPLSAEDYRTHYFGAPRERIYQELYGRHAAAAHDLFGAFVIREHARLLKPIAGAADVIKLLRQQRIPLAVISNKKPDYIAMELKAFGWERDFAIVVGAGQAAADKPSGAPILWAAAQMKLDGPRQGIWYVGDTEIDMKAAQNADVTAIYVHEECEEHRWLAQYQPLKVVRNLAALQQFLLQTL